MFKHVLFWRDYYCQLIVFAPKSSKRSIIKDHIFGIKHRLLVIAFHGLALTGYMKSKKIRERCIKELTSFKPSGLRKCTRPKDLENARFVRKRYGQVRTQDFQGTEHSAALGARPLREG